MQQPCPVLHLSACHPLCSLVVTEERAEQPDGLQQAVDWASSAARPKVMDDLMQQNIKTARRCVFARQG